MPDPTDKHVGARVRMRRLMLDMSQTNLAQGLGVSFQQIQKYEKGTNRISASRLQQLSKILQVSIPFFFEGLSDQRPTSKKVAEPPIPVHVSDFLTTSDGLALTKAYIDIKNQRLRRTIVHLVEQIASVND